MLTTTDLGAMTKITLKELTVGRAAEKRFLLCRAVVGPVRDRWRVSTLIEDEDGNVEPLWLFQRECEPLWPPLGAILVIKEPFLKFDLPDSHHLRIDTMIEVIEVDPADVELAGPWAVADERGVSEIKSEGLSLLDSGAFAGALRLLRRAIRKGADDAETRVGIARCLMDDERFYEAAGELELIADPEERVKELLGDCLYAIRDWAGAAKVYGPEGRAKCESRLAEASGKFDWDAAMRKQLPVMADFLGPVELKTPQSGRRGMFAMRALKPGDLLSVGTTYAKGVNMERHLVGVSIGRSGPGAQSESNPALALALLHKLERNPQDLPEIYRLCCGPRGVPPLPAPGVIDVERVEEIQYYNRFGTEGKISELIPTNSYYNHDCYGNTTHVTMGGAQIIRALFPIAQGEEVFLPYTGNLDPLDERTERFLGMYGFNCECETCKRERKGDKDCLHAAITSSDQGAWRRAISLILGPHPQRPLPGEVVGMMAATRMIAQRSPVALRDFDAVALKLMERALEYHPLVDAHIDIPLSVATPLPHGDVRKRALRALLEQNDLFYGLSLNALAELFPQLKPLLPELQRLQRQK